jgi:hypothetical protein
MNTTSTRSAAPQAQVSATARIVTALAVTVALALAWIGAGHASEQAVQMATQAIAGGATHITLPAVEIVGRREAKALQS